MDEVRITRHDDLTRFFDHAPIGFSLLDSELRYIRINAALAEINGRSKEDHIGRFQHELVPEVDDIISRVQRRVIEGGAVSTGHRVLVETPAHPGVMREFEVDYFPVPNGEDGNHLGCCVYESSESTSLIDALERETARSRELAEKVNFFLASLAPDGIVREVNRPALDVAGLRSSDVRGVPFWDCPWWNYDDVVRAAMRSRVEDAQAGELQRFELAAKTAHDGLIDLDVQLTPLMDEKGQVCEIVTSGVDITQQRRAERQREIHVAELQHRVKNIFSNVQSLMRMIAGQSDDLDDFKAKFDDRLVALARANDALLKTEWSDMPVRDLISMELAPYVEGNKSALKISGPPCNVPERSASMIGLAIHELATNAAKYGALSRAGGTVDITLTADDADMMTSFTWRERGGPPIQPSGNHGVRSGFGSVLLERIVPGTMELNARIERQPEGLTYRLE